VEGYALWGQRLEDGLNIELRATGDTDVEVWEAKVNKSLTSSSTSSRGDGILDESGHSSIASMMM